jgi:hypothetical protein
MTKALVIIEVDINTGRDRSAGLGESSHLDHHGIRFIEDEKRGEIWDRVHGWLQNQNEFITVKKVSLIKEVLNG